MQHLEAYIGLAPALVSGVLLGLTIILLMNMADIYRKGIHSFNGIGVVGNLIGAWAGIFAFLANVYRPLTLTLILFCGLFAVTAVVLHYFVVDGHLYNEDRHKNYTLISVITIASCALMGPATLWAGNEGWSLLSTFGGVIMTVASVRMFINFVRNVGKTHVYASQSDAYAGLLFGVIGVALLISQSWHAHYTTLVQAIVHFS